MGHENQCPSLSYALKRVDDKLSEVSQSANTAGTRSECPE
jgi:hypothetical protein